MYFEANSPDSYVIGSLNQEQVDLFKERFTECSIPEQNLEEFFSSRRVLAKKHFQDFLMSSLLLSEELYKYPGESLLF